MNWVVPLFILGVVVVAIGRFVSGARHLGQMRDAVKSHSGHTQGDLNAVSVMRWLWALPVILVVLLALSSVCK